MSTQAILFLLLGFIILALVGVITFLLFRFYKTNKKIEELLEKGNAKDLKTLLLSQKDKSTEIEEDFKGVLLRVKKLEDICETAVQKISVVRYNPFGDVGGNQSFAIALLDRKNNGFLISSLYIKEGSRVYAKPVKGGKSDHALSKEETEALNAAINTK